MMNDQRQGARRKAGRQKKKSKIVRGVLVLLIHVQSVLMPAGDEDEGRWNRKRKEN
jgi:hypothetical protein